MARVTATSSGMAAVSSTVADPASGRRRPVAERARAEGAMGPAERTPVDAATASAVRTRFAAVTTSADPEQGSDMVEDAVEEIGDGAVARPRQGERGDGGRDGSYQT